jgi:Sel1 repeat
MAMSGVVIPRLAAFAGILPSTMDRLIRDLRANGLAPMGKHGRGQEHGQFEASHLSHIILGFAASLPSGAAEAVKDLRPLYAENLQGGFAAGDLAETLGGNLEDEIIRRARIILSKNSEVLQSNNERWELTLCLNPVMAWESWITDNIDTLPVVRKDAATGNELAEYYLGYAYEHGIGVPRDIEKSYIYYLKSSSSNDEKVILAAIHGGVDVGLQLTSDQLKSAGDLVFGKNLTSHKGEVR